MRITYVLLLLSLFFCADLDAQRKKKKKREETPPAPLTMLPPVSDSMFHDLKWRNIGPFRGGRSVTSVGVIGQDGVYYMGSTGGGIFKTTNDGITWTNVSDGFLKTGTVGALAVSESNPNIVLAGMGEHAARGVMTSMGDGVYRSTDAGKTWHHLGLEESRHIGDVIIHPQNPDVMFVAAQGAQYGPGGERGVYRTTDGGANWERVLHVNETTGAVSLVLDFNNPLILYAAMWDHQRKPWTMISGGPGSGLYKSSDGGSSWEKLTKGLPDAFGKAGISVSRADGDVVYAVIEAEGTKAGVYRSADAGASWTQVSKDRVNVARSWYYMEIFADPQEVNTVYCLNAPVMKSTDGGRTWNNVPTPHGDNHHLWINPTDNRKMINSNDGGANISNNGGRNWSTQQNQATAQFYRVIADNLVPYNVYGGQQDNSAIRISSRTKDGGIDWKDWESVAGCESAYLAFDPDNPEVVYGGCYQGIIEKYVMAAKEGKAIKEYPELALGNVPADFKYRYNWNAPIISSPHDRNTIYHAGNVVFKTTDGGISWSVVSPDLTRDEQEKQGPGGGPYTNEAAGGENYNTIMYLVESPHEEGVLWAGSDDGLIHLTKDGGGAWTNVTPAGLPEGIINSIEVSPHDPATAYVAVMRYKQMDLKPYIFKTTDYGQSWTSITDGITGKHTFVRVVREDPKREGLLYAGTETGLFISLDGGAQWSPFQLNLPVVPINDLYIQDNDLIAATAGRSFWILDDLGALQALPNDRQDVELISPKPTYRIVGGSSSRGNGLGQNPASGVTMDYYLAKPGDSATVTLDILKDGSLVRSFSSEAVKDFKSWPGGPSRPDVLPAKEGFNRFTWDFRREQLPAVDKVFVYGSYAGSMVPPGTYTLMLMQDGTTSETTVEILPDPAIEATEAAYAEQDEVLEQISRAISEIHESVNQMRSAKEQITRHREFFPDHDQAEIVSAMGDSIIKKIDAWEKALIQPSQKTFQDVINFHNRLNAELMNLKGYVEGPMPEVTQGAKDRLADLMQEWDKHYEIQQAIIKEDVKEYNEAYLGLNLPAIILDKKP
jgi:photosystem II stability/assembly factor-like uncharacterized protein